MHVGLNCVFLVPGETGGMEVMARELVPALRDAAPGVRFTAFVSRAARDADLGIDRVVLPVDARNRLDWVRGEQLVLPRAAARAGVDLVHSLGSTAPAAGPFSRVVTIHDLHYLTAPDAHFGLRALGMRVLVPLGARRSDRLIAISEQTRGEVIERLHVPGDRVDVVHNGLGRPPGVAPTPEPELRRRLDLRGRAVLQCLSAKRPHKNLGALLDALAAIGPEHRPVAVIAGYPTPHEAELRQKARALGIDADVRFPGWLSDADVEGLFALSRVFAFPSLAEGFGLPVLEAMARGVPVVCSDIPVFREVAADAARYFDPRDPSSIAAAILDPPDPVRGLARAAHFTWDRAARETLAVYERAR